MNVYFMVGNGAIVLQKSLSGLLRGKTSNHHGDFYCLNCNHSYSTENRLKKHEKICNKSDSCRIEMPKRFEKILKYNHGEKSLKALFFDLSRFRMLATKNAFVSKQSWKILHRKKS